MREYTWPAAGCPRGAIRPAGHDDADQPVDDLVDRGPVGAALDLVALADGGMGAARSARAGGSAGAKPRGRRRAVVVGAQVTTSTGPAAGDRSRSTSAAVSAGRADRALRYFSRARASRTAPS